MTEVQRVAIVTGAAGGIGRVMTQALLGEGIRVAAIDRDREPLEALAATAREQRKAAELSTIATDLTDDSHGALDRDSGLRGRACAREGGSNGRAITPAGPDPPVSWFRI